MKKTITIEIEDHPHDTQITIHIDPKVLKASNDALKKIIKALGEVRRLIIETTQVKEVKHGKR